ncbi:unnamed protein product [Symbiodinium sp. CCMP2592]|nr:unnamed protein product [Symbiodinium sp. CCMP2592]
MPGMRLPANQEQIPTWARELDREMMQRPQTLQVPMAEKSKARNAFGDVSTTASSATRGDASTPRPRSRVYKSNRSLLRV